MQVCTIIKQIQRHSFVTFYWLHEWFFCRNQRHITQSINWEILKTKSQQNSVFLNQKLSFSNLFRTSVIITFSVRSDMVRTSHLSMIAGAKDHLCKILKALTECSGALNYPSSVASLHKGQVMRKLISCHGIFIIVSDDVLMSLLIS